jgi:hypothetical protein
MKNKQRAVCVLLVLGSILLLVGAWNLSEDAYTRSREVRAV